LLNEWRLNKQLCTENRLPEWMSPRRRARASKNASVKPSGGEHHQENPACLILHIELNCQEKVFFWLITISVRGHTEQRPA
jgi:hypothetical protein